MESFFNFIQQYAPFLISYKYLILFLGGMIEGFNVLILAGFIASSGQVKLLYIFPLLVVAHTINGYGWYLVGYLGGARALDKWGHKNKISHQVIERIEEYFKKYSSRAIMFAKFTFSLEIATMILSGSLRYDLKKFSKYNFYGSIGWVALTVSVGYFFGTSFKLFFSFLKNFTLFFVFLGIAIALTYIMKILFKKYFVGYLTVQKRVKEMGEKLRGEISDFMAEGKDD